MHDPKYTTRSEIARCLLLLAISLWLVHPYFAPRLIGAGDALWYHHLLADAITQFRAGVFPVFVGQSEFSFNGAVYPLRAAPYYQYLAGGLDLVTGRSLSFFALQHLTVVLSVVGGIFSAYLALVWIAPRQRWTAAALAALYVLCPGVVGLFYAQDLYMSGMAIPWVPLACAALLRACEDDSPMPLIVLAVSLAALWWAHSPIALWTTLVAVVAQLTALAAAPEKKTALRRGLMGAALFVPLAAYPIISVFLLRSPGETIVPYLMDRIALLREVRAVFPATLLPLDPTAPSLSMLQLGYSLWLALLLTILVWLKRRPRGAVVLLAATGFLLVLVFPVPIVTRALWFSFPETLVGMTLYWPMQRLYILIAALIIVCGQRALAELDPPGKQPARLCFAIALLLGVGWSAIEAFTFIKKTRTQADTAADSRRWAMPENVAIQRHTYGLFAGRPSYFTHGVVDPRLELRLLALDDQRQLASNYPSAKATDFRDEFTGAVDANPGILNLRPNLTLVPGQRYVLTFDFARAETTGILQVIGPEFYREYILPVSGDRKAFGVGPEAEKSIALWTSAAQPQTVTLRFIPTAAGAKATDYVNFARYRFAPYDLTQLPIKVASLIPLRAEANSAAPALLETPRMFVPGYIATVNGSTVPVQKSREGLVAFPVGAGPSRIELRFAGPFLLRFAFWVCGAAWICVAGWLGVKLINRQPAASTTP